MFFAPYINLFLDRPYDIQQNDIWKNDIKPND